MPRPIVQSINVTIVPKRQGKHMHHSYEQDDKYTQYGLVLSKYGLATAMVDLKEHKVVLLRNPRIPEEILEDYRMEVYLKVVGVSQGSIGVWSYSRDYLQRRCPELPSGVEMLLSSFLHLGRITLDNRTQ